MSTVQVSNIHSESTGNNRIQLEGSNVSVYQAGRVLLTANSSDMTLSNGSANATFGTTVTSSSSLPVGSYIISTTTPNNSYLQANAYYSKSTYSTLYSAIGDIDGSAFVFDTLTAKLDASASPLSYKVLLGNSRIIVFNGVSSYTYSDDKGLTFSSVSTLSAALPLGVAYGNGVFVVSLDNNLLFSSANGTSWTSRTQANTSARITCVYGNGVFVFAGNNGAIQTSSDGTTWTNRTTANSNWMYGSAYGNGVFVLGGNNGAIQTSSDNGVTWTNRTTANTDKIISIAYGNGVFIAAGESTGAIQRSTDNGVTWTNITLPNSVQNRYVVYGNGVFISPASNYGSLYSLNNGVNWYPHLSLYKGISGDITYSEGYFFITNGALYYRSTSANSSLFYVPAHPLEIQEDIISYVRAQ